MTEKTLSEFLAEAEKLILSAAKDVDYVKIRTAAGNAVLVSEEEWNSHVEAMKILLQSVK